MFLLGLLRLLFTGFFLYGAVLMASGALTIMAADRILGGRAGWREVWGLLLQRLAPLLSGVVRAAGLVAIGLALSMIPVLGLVFMIAVLIMGLFFAFVPSVALIEGLGGSAALRRSAGLVRSDWLRVALAIIALAVVCWLAQAVAYLLLPRSAPFFGSLFGDLFAMVLLPVPVLGLVLLYLDVRRKRDGFTQDGLRAELDALKQK
jgi:hypothetical protein